MTTRSPEHVTVGAAETARRGRTRERLLDAAYEVFAELGVHAASVEQVCERAGFTRGAFYSNFTTKEELFFALMEREHALRLTALTEKVDALLPTLDGLGDLDELGEAKIGDLVLEFLVGPFDNRTWCLVSSEFLLLAMRDPSVATDYLAYQQRFEDSLLPIVQRAAARAGREFTMDPRAAVRLLCTVQADAMQTFILAGGGPDERDLPRLALTRTLLVVTRPLQA
ncbi:MAG TPA: TetR/AcrR family transcriptional regulator [Actinotalea sp.]|jgi:AcrR family transcriptional regulator